MQFAYHRKTLMLIHFSRIHTLFHIIMIATLYTRLGERKCAELSNYLLKGVAGRRGTTYKHEQFAFKLRELAYKSHRRLKQSSPGPLLVQGAGVTWR